MDLSEFSKQLNEIGGTGPSVVIGKLVEMVKSFGGSVYLVGGAVRDELMGMESKDYDFLITKITLDELAKKLQQALPGAKINEVGQSFGVIKMTLGSDEYDFAIPRADMDRDTVKTDPNIPVEQDLMRRDFTINALAKDLETGQIISPEGQNGQQDIKDKLIRAVGDPSARFREDPLRMLRAIQFAARFGFTIDPKTLLAMKENVDLLRGVSAERFYEEFKKAWTKGNADTEVFFNLLHQTDLGSVMFGSDFQPVALNMKKHSGHEGFLIQGIAAFLNGGDYQKLILKNDEQDIIRVARWFRNTIKGGLDLNTIKSVSKFGKYFPLIHKAFDEIDGRTRGVLGMRMKSLISKPLIPKETGNSQEPWELPLTGGEIMEISKEMGQELKGKAISETILKLIGLYQKGTITVADSPEKNKEIIKDALKGLINENYVKEADRLSILTKRMSNIFYK